LISTDHEQSWKQERVFTGGEIITVIQQKSTDQGRTFDSIAMDASFRQSVLYFRNAYTQSGIQKRDDEFIMSEGFNAGKKRISGALW